MSGYLDMAVTLINNLDELVETQKPKFIALTLSTGKVFVSVKSIIGFERSKESKTTAIYTNGQDNYWTVNETPEEILKLIGKA